MHPAIELLIARMKSNPEEFIRGEWEMEEDNCRAHANEEELAALKATRRTITLDGVHKQIMKHLLNPVQLDLFSQAEEVCIPGVFAKQTLPGHLKTPHEPHGKKY